MSMLLRIDPEVAEALAAGAPVVALESTLIAHGLPRGRNLEVARELEAVVRAQGAVPATIAIVDGVVRVGLDGPQLEALALGEGVVAEGPAEPESRGVRGVGVTPVLLERLHSETGGAPIEANVALVLR